jgi:glycine C-acetyltransferase
MSEQGTQMIKQNPLQYVSEQLKELREKGVAPKLRVLQGEQKAVCAFDGKEVINWHRTITWIDRTKLRRRRSSGEEIRRRRQRGAHCRNDAICMQLEERIAKFKSRRAWCSIGIHGECGNDVRGAGQRGFDYFG